MLLSDKLTEIGLSANSKNNLSMAEKAEQMHETIKQYCHGNNATKQVYNIVSYVCETLNKKGYNYYKPDLFFETK